MSGPLPAPAPETVGFTDRLSRTVAVFRAATRGLRARFGRLTATLRVLPDLFITAERRSSADRALERAATRLPNAGGEGAEGPRPAVQACSPAGAQPAGSEPEDRAVERPTNTAQLGACSSVGRRLR
jgi:hypothetical protein